MLEFKLGLEFRVNYEVSEKWDSSQMQCGAVLF